jgi:hypothetical protein
MLFMRAASRQFIRITRRILMALFAGFHVLFVGAALICHKILRYDSTVFEAISMPPIANAPRSLALLSIKIIRSLLREYHGLGVMTDHIP